MANLAFDATSNSGYQTTDVYSWSHTCTGSNGLLIIAVSIFGAGAVSGVTYGSKVLDFIGAKNSADETKRVEFWGVIAPDTGANTAEVSLTAAVDSVSGALSFTAANQTWFSEGFTGATAVNGGAADATVNVTTVADNDWVIDVVVTDDTAITATQTEKWNITGAGGSGASQVQGPITPAGATATAWTAVGAGKTWVIAGLALRNTTADGAYIIPIDSTDTTAYGWEPTP